MSEVATTTAKAVSDQHEARAIEALREAWENSFKDLKTAEHGKALAEHAANVAKVWLSRTAILTAVHPSVLNRKAPEMNISGAARALKVPYATLYPYIQAGMALAKHQREGLLSAPSKEDITLVVEAFDEVANAKRREDRALEAEARKVAKAEALALEQAGANGETGEDGEVVPPVKVPTLAEETLEGALLLVKRIKALRRSKEWSGATAEAVTKALAEVYPALKV
jgi:hypothetical protein